MKDTSISYEPGQTNYGKHLFSYKRKSTVQSLFKEKGKLTSVIGKVQVATSDRKPIVKASELVHP